MASLYFTAVDVYRKEKIFGDKDISVAATKIKSTLKKAGDEEMVVFSIDGVKGLTKGELFVKDGFLVFGFNTIKGEPHLDLFSFENEIDAEIHYEWNLLPGREQSFYRVKSFGGKKEVPSMIMVKFTRPEPKRPQVGGGSEKRGKKEAVREKIRLLKEMKDEGLITGDQYDEKVMKLLNML